MAGLLPDCRRVEGLGVWKAKFAPRIGRCVQDEAA